MRFQAGRTRDWLTSCALHAGVLGAMFWGAQQREAAPVQPIQNLGVAISWAPQAVTLAPQAPVEPIVAEPETKPLPRAPKRSEPVVEAAPAQPSRREVAAKLPAGPENTPEPSPEKGPGPQLADKGLNHPVPDKVQAPAQPEKDAVKPPPKPADTRPWQAHLEQLLHRNKHYPLAARRMRQTGVVTVNARFDEAGVLVHCAVAESSGFRVLDEAALALVRTASDLARLQLVPGRAAELRLPIVYELKES